MVKPLQRGELKDLSGGLVTEASPMQFPPNATKDELNFELNLDGTRSRRMGIDVSGTAIPTGISWGSASGVGYSSFVWEGPGSDSSKKFLVTQVSGVVRIFDTSASPISSALIYQATLASNPAFSWSYASYGGKLYITSGTPTIEVLSYNSTNSTFTRSIERLTIRDLFGVEETIEPKYETDPQYRGLINPEHFYNLYNQSWAIPRFPWLYGDNALQNAAIMAGAPTVSPSNSDTVWMGMDFRTVSRESVGTPPTTTDPGDQSFFYNSLECFNKKQFDAVTGEQGMAPKGHYIIDAFNTGTSRTAALANTLSKYPASAGLYGAVVFPEVINGGLGTCAAYSGRIFYSGYSGTVQNGDKRSPDYSNFVFFSQLIQRPTDAFKCYQEGDPTSRETSDIIDTDGGFVKVAGATGIQKLIALGQRLIVIAENGIWAIAGEDNGSFKATSYKVEKISSNGCISQYSVIDAGDTLYYCGADAIYRVQANQFGDLGAVDITSAKIKKFYANLTLVSKQISHGAFDRFTNRVHWLFYNANGAPSDGVAPIMLSFDVQLGSFYKYQIMNSPGNNPFFFGAFLAPDTLNTGTAGTTPTQGLPPKTNKIKFAGVTNINGIINLIIAEFKNPDFRDWKYFGGNGYDAKAYLLVGDTTLGDIGVKKQINYLQVVMKNTEKTITDDVIDRESGCLARSQWDFADSIISNRWSTPTQVFRRARTRGDDGSGDFYTGHEYLVSKSKMRGRGKVFSLYLESEEFKDCNLVGWNLEITTNGVS